MFYADPRNEIILNIPKNICLSLDYTEDGGNQSDVVKRYSVFYVIGHRSFRIWRTDPEGL